jgi:hypothetical protein
MALAGFNPLGHVLKAEREVSICLTTKEPPKRQNSPTTVEDRVASVQTKRVLHLLLSLGAVRITRIRHPSVSSHECGRAEVFVLVPPVRRARSRTTSTQDAFVHSIELLSVRHRLQVFTAFWDIIVLQEWLDGLVLLVELGEIRNQILDDVH